MAASRSETRTPVPGKRRPGAVEVAASGTAARVAAGQRLAAKGRTGVLVMG